MKKDVYMYVRQDWDSIGKKSKLRIKYLNIKYKIWRGVAKMVE